MTTQKYKAVNAFIFAGSFSIGVMKAGFDLKGVLEMTDDMLERNAFYFHKNYPSIPVILPKDWENDAYLDELGKKNIDLMCCNCPCSSLSRVNRNASVDGKNNVHFYRLFNIFEHVKPKAFVIENAPTLIKLGFPILKDMVKKLSGLYRFTIIRDMAGNHSTPMKRMRTLVIGWRKDCFSEIPVIEMKKTKQMTVRDALYDIYDDTTDDDCPPELVPMKSLFKYAIPKRGIIASLAVRMNNGEKDCIEELNKILPSTTFKNILPTIARKIKAGLGFWDKSAKRMPEDGVFPSFSEPQQYLHPIQNRCLNRRELKRLMGYDDSFDFTDPKNECKTAMRVAMAQGVPVNFGKYIAGEVKRCLDGGYETFAGDEVVFQNNCTGYAQEFKTYEDFLSLDFIDSGKKGIKLEK